MQSAPEHLNGVRCSTAGPYMSLYYLEAAELVTYMSGLFAERRAYFWPDDNPYRLGRRTPPAQLDGTFVTARAALRR